MDAWQQPAQATTSTLIGEVEYSTTLRYNCKSLAFSEQHRAEKCHVQMFSMIQIRFHFNSLKIFADLSFLNT